MSTGFVVVTKKQMKTPGRPRKFDTEQAVAVAQGLFHARGYDAVSVADVTDALGINPPSFYGAFGNKAGLYARVLDRYAETGAIPLAELLSDDLTVAEALTALLEEAARRYGGDEICTGCLVLEGTRCNDPQAREASKAFHMAAEETIRRFIATRYPKDAGRLTDFVSTVMSGLSSKARQGHGVEQLLSSAHLAGLALAASIQDQIPFKVYPRHV